MCLLCKTIVRSEDVWKIHINAKQHKQNVESAKKLKAQTNNFTSASLKRSATPPSVQSEQPIKRIKGILKNSTSIVTMTESNDTATAATKSESANKNRKSAVPSDFFDAVSSKKNHPETANYFEATLEKTSIRKDLLNIRREPHKIADGSVPNADTDGIKVDDKDEALPEGFFDDPIKDAKARNLEYKDPVEEEWERFQKEIKAAANFSNAIIAEDQEEATAERQIDEIDEQIRNWSRFVYLLYTHFFFLMQYLILYPL